MKPNLICPGAAKAATTWMALLLDQHPDIYVPGVKETDFFTEDFDRGISYYMEAFAGDYKGQEIIGDFGNIYMVDERVPERIFRSLGRDVKFLFMLRDPVRRMHSKYYMNRTKCLDPENSFLEAVLRDKTRSEDLSMKIKKHPYDFDYLEESLYGKALDRFLIYYPIEAMHFVVFEDFIERPGEVLEGIMDFLGLDSSFEFDLTKDKNESKVYTRNRGLVKAYNTLMMNKSLTRLLYADSNKFLEPLKKIKRTFFGESYQKNPVLSEEDYRKLYPLFREDISRLETLTGLSLKKWRYSP